jgi:hypothetical protein
MLMPRYHDSLHLVLREYCFMWKENAEQPDCLFLWSSFIFLLVIVLRTRSIERLGLRWF